MPFSFAQWCRFGRSALLRELRNLTGAHCECKQAALSLLVGVSCPSWGSKRLALGELTLLEFASALTLPAYRPIQAKSSSPFRGTPCHLLVGAGTA
jgi:hypothetical protein